jgi:hypothetical protein
MQPEEIKDPDEDFFPPPADVTRELYLKWRSPRFGKSNPDDMSNPVWDWLIRTRINAYRATELLGGPSSFGAGPAWCFDRYGRSSTVLHDGRIVLIAGEHEDYYDPDFHIYNDVVIYHESGRIQQLGYPREVFPPTDFHSATLVSNEIMVIGNLGYQDERLLGTTPVRVLDLKTFAFSTPKTCGTPPGWIHDHTAELSADRQFILVQRGKVVQGESKSLIENIDDWRLDLKDWRWERLTARQWPRWEIRREDGQRTHLFEYQQAIWEREIPAYHSQMEELSGDLKAPSLEEVLGMPPDLDRFNRLYKPSIAHEVIRDEDEGFRVRRIRVAGVIVRYVDDMDCIQMTVEGDLLEEVTESLSRELVETLAAIENSPCTRTRI